MLLNIRKIIWLFLCGMLVSAYEARGEDKARKGSDSNDKRVYSVTVPIVPLQRVEYGNRVIIVEPKSAKEKTKTNKKVGNKTTDKKNNVEPMQNQEIKYRPSSAPETGSEDRNEIEQRNLQNGEQKAKTETKRKLWRWF